MRCQFRHLRTQFSQQQGIEFGRIRCHRSCQSRQESRCSEEKASESRIHISQLNLESRPRSCIKRPQFQQGGVNSPFVRIRLLRPVALVALHVASGIWIWLFRRQIIVLFLEQCIQFILMQRAIILGNKAQSTHLPQQSIQPGRANCSVKAQLIRIDSVKRRSSAQQIASPTC